MNISADQVKELRQMTGSSVALCKKALEDAGGNVEKALALLNKSAEALAAKKSERATGSGLIETYVHTNKRVGVLLELRCETDFVARTKEFQALAHDITLHIAGMKPQYVSNDSIPVSAKEDVRKFFADEAAKLGKSAEMTEKIIQGKLEKYFSDVSLLSQSFVKDDTITVSDLIKRCIGHLGEKIEVLRFQRYEL